MNAYTTEVSYSPVAALALPPILVSGTDQAAIERGARTVEAFGMRVADRVLASVAAERIRNQISLSAVWLELGGDDAPTLYRDLREIGDVVASRRCGLIIAAPARMIDLVAATLDFSDAEVVIEGDEAARASALALALARSNSPLRLSDAASDRSAERLRQLSDEVGRIASTLARLSTNPAVPATSVEMPATDSPEVSGELVRTIIRARRLRSRFFPEDLFADPAWDMLLDLLQAEIAQLRVPVSSLCIAASVPATTALRWLKTMTEQGLFVRRADPHDGRRVCVELAPQASRALRSYFAEVGKVAVI